MKLKVILSFVTLTLMKSVVSEEIDGNFFVTSTSKPTTEDHKINERLTRVEFYLEIRSALNVLNESITELQKTKRQYIDEVEDVLEKKLQLYRGELQRDLKDHLTETKNEMRQNMQRQLIEMKQEIKEEFVQNKAILDENLKLYVQKFQNQLTEIKEDIIIETRKVEHNMQNQIAKMKEEIKEDLRGKSAMIEELKTIRNQLTRTELNLTTEIKECKNLPQDCREVKKRGKTISGVYHIHPQFAADDFVVWCDMTTKGGGWTYILNRFDGSQNFYLNWTDYKQGFGKLSGEHWLGLEHVHHLTYNKPHELLVELTEWNLKKYYALYSHFKVGNEAQAYVVESLGEYSGDAGDSFKTLGKNFSTSDRNHDSEQANDTPCADYFESGWWFHWCFNSLLTGQYRHNSKPDENFRGKSAIQWTSITGHNHTLKEARMMIRPSDA